jgi:zinc protease
MNSAFRSAAAALLVLLVAAPAGAAVKVQQVVSASGIKAWLVEDHSNPIISLTASFRAGASRDAPGKAGTARMVSALLDEGAGDMKSLAYQRRLEALSISLDFEVGRDTFRATMRTLSRHRDEAFHLLGLALNKPRFDPDAIDRIRQQLLARVLRDLHKPSVVARNAWWKAAFPHHPYGRPVDGTGKTLQAITRPDLVDYVGHNFARDNLYIGVVGDITAAELRGLLDRTFGTLPAKATGRKVPPVKPRLTGKVIVRKLDVPQSVAVFGQAGIPRRDKDFYAAYVLNYILGGGSFSSRLYEQVREKRGLAYSVYSYLLPMDHSALYLGAVATRNAKVAESVKLIREEWAKTAKNGATAAELKAAKRYITGSYALRFSSSMRISEMLAALQQEHLPIDYFVKRNGYINAVTVADVNRVAARLLKAKSLTFVVVGEPIGL